MLPNTLEILGAGFGKVSEDGGLFYLAKTTDLSMILCQWVTACNWIIFLQSSFEKALILGLPKLVKQ